MNTSVYQHTFIFCEVCFNDYKYHCKNCKTSYCSKICQHLDWKYLNHKLDCCVSNIPLELSLPDTVIIFVGWMDFIKKNIFKKEIVSRYKKLKSR